MIGIESVDLIVGLFLFALGACLGSFLNVCIVRMPHESSVVLPASHCPQCKTSIAWYDNIPLLSYLFLRGRCRQCHIKIPIRYFFVELLTALTFVGMYRYYGLNIVLIPYLFMMCGFIVATFTDFEHRIIPDEVSVGGMYAGVLLSFLIPQLHHVILAKSNPSVHSTELFVFSIIFVIVMAALIYFFGTRTSWLFPKKWREEYEITLLCIIGVFLLIKIGAFYLTRHADFMSWFIKPQDNITKTLADVFMSLFYPGFSLREQIALPHLQSLGFSLNGVLVGGLSTYLLGELGELLFKKESMGGGDIKLLAMIGAFMGAKLTILTFFIAPFFGAVVGIAEKIRTKDSYIAYGPFLIAGALISLFYGDQIISWIINGYRF